MTNVVKEGLIHRSTFVSTTNWRWYHLWTTPICTHWFRRIYLYLYAELNSLWQLQRHLTIVSVWNQDPDVLDGLNCDAWSTPQWRAVVWSILHTSLDRAHCSPPPSSRSKSISHKKCKTGQFSDQIHRPAPPAGDSRSVGSTKTRQDVSQWARCRGQAGQQTTLARGHHRVKLTTLHSEQWAVIKNHCTVGSDHDHALHREWSLQLNTHIQLLLRSLLLGCSLTCVPDCLPAPMDFNYQLVDTASARNRNGSASVSIPAIPSLADCRNLFMSN